MKAFGLFILFFFAWAQPAFGATIHLEVETDKDIYFPGQTVNWTIYSWADPAGNQGIALLSVHLDDDTGEALNPPANSGSEFTDTEYGFAEKFIVAGPGTPAATSPRLRDILVFQLPTPAGKLFNIGNDGVRHVYCKGTYTVNTLGNHTLDVILNSANYWPDAVSDAVAFEASDATPALFDVIPEPTVCGEPGTVFLASDLAMPQDCYVNLIDFTVFEMQWMDDTCVATSWCAGSDMDKSGDVGLPDLHTWTLQWLWCTDPANAACDIYWK